MTTRFCGRSNPELTNARSTRCMLSRTAASGRPTRIVFGKPAGETSTSTSTGTASIPCNANVFNLASMGSIVESGLAPRQCWQTCRPPPTGRIAANSCAHTCDSVAAPPIAMGNRFRYPSHGGKWILSRGRKAIISAHEQYSGRSTAACVRSAITRSLRRRPRGSMFAHAHGLVEQPCIYSVCCDSRSVASTTCGAKNRIVRQGPRAPPPPALRRRVV